MTRLPPITPDNATDEQLALHASICESRGGSMRITKDDGSLVGPFNAMLTRPNIGWAMTSLGAQIRFENRLPAHLLETAICTVGARWESEFEFAAHAQFALDAGVPDQVLEALAAHVEPTFDDPQMELVWRYTDQLAETGRVSDELTEAVVETFGHETLVDLIQTIGYYSHISLLLNAVAIGPPAGAAARWA